jgi:hypothetical protein
VSETEGGVLDIHFGNRPLLTYAALVWWKRTHLTRESKNMCFNVFFCMGKYMCLTFSIHKKHRNWLTASDYCKNTVWSYLADYLLGYYRLFKHHTYGSNLWLKKRPCRLLTDCTAPTFLKNGNGDNKIKSKYQD